MSPHDKQILAMLDKSSYAALYGGMSIALRQDIGEIGFDIIDGNDNN